MTVGEALGVFRCGGCAAPFMACPDCVNVLRIDPETGVPPDVRVVDGKAVHVEPDPEAVTRSVQQPACDRCIEYRNAEKLRGAPGTEHIEAIVPLWVERHQRNHI